MLGSGAAFASFAYLSGEPENLDLDVFTNRVLSHGQDPLCDIFRKVVFPADLANLGRDSFDNHCGASFCGVTVTTPGFVSPCLEICFPKFGIGFIGSTSSRPEMKDLFPSFVKGDKGRFSTS
jgi:hypothetical protein